MRTHLFIFKNEITTHTMRNPAPVSSSSAFACCMPAEWSSHSACLILYPHNKGVFRLDCKPAREEVKCVAQAIAHDGDEDVILLCPTENDASELRDELKNVEIKENNKIQVCVCPSDDSWVRDTGPTFVISKNINNQNHLNKIVGLNWEFNAYGGPTDGCYWPCDLDRKVASNICRQLDFECQEVPLVLEGGSIHTDGEGTLLTTEECLLHTNRNPRLSKEDIENTVLRALGCNKTLWLPFGLYADMDTNGHIDNMACFIKPGHIVLSWCDDKEKDPENYERCRKAMDVLDSQVDAKGRNLTVHKLNLPPPLYYTKEEVETLYHGNDEASAADRVVGERLAASYVNFYIANRAVIVPQFNVEPSDKQALQTLQELFRDRKVVGIKSREILLGGGNIHCITQQVPSLPKC